MRRPAGSWWAAEWHSRNRIDGDRRYLVWGDQPTLFRTRRECRAWIEEHYGYIRDRDDLRAEPYGWRMPRAVLVDVVVRG